MRSLLLDFQLGASAKAWLHALRQLPELESASDLEPKMQLAFKEAPSVNELKQQLDCAEITETVKFQMHATLDRLSAALTSVNGSDLASACSGEFPSADELASIVSISLCLEKLELASVFCLPIGLVTGIATEADQSKLLPYPSTVALFSPRFSVSLLRTGSIIKPLTAAFICEVAKPVPAIFTFEKLDAIANGAAEGPVRLVLGQLGTPTERPCNQFVLEEMLVIECNLDDASPQAIAFATEELTIRGASDVFVTPCLMKKGRSGHLLTVISDPDHAPLIRSYLLANTSTLGLREHQVARHILERSWVDVMLTDSHSARVKIATDKSGKILHALPEYEDCARYARQTGKSFTEAHNEIMAKFARNQGSIRAR